MSPSSATSSAAFAAGAALGTAAGYGLALWLLPFGGVSGALADLKDKERLADAIVSLREQFAKLTASSPSAAAAAAEAEGADSTTPEATAPPAPEAHPLSDPKMVLVVRRDLEMGKGKIGAQCGHAVSLITIIITKKNQVPGGRKENSRSPLFSSLSISLSLSLSLFHGPLFLKNKKYRPSASTRGSGGRGTTA